MGEEPAEEPRFRAIPESVGRFRIDRVLGSGGMASVYLAHEDGPGGFQRRVALKFLHPHLAEEPSVVAQFVREAKIAARIRHANVVSVLEVAEHAGLVFLVMDFVDGESLASLTQKLGRSAIPLRVGLRIVCDSLAGVEAAHELVGDDGAPLGIVHRDFSPQNLLIGRDGRTRLTDFGVAKIAAGTQHTRAGVVKGKIGYMSPEQARGRAVDRRTDVWAAGVVAWELIAQRRLYAGSDDLSRLFDVATRTPPRLSTILSEIAPALDEAVASALTRKPDRRCPSAEALRARLAAAVPGGLASAAEVAELVAAAEQASRSGVRTTTVLDDDALPTGSLSASISTDDVSPLVARPRRRWLVRAIALGGAAVALILTAAALRQPDPPAVERLAPTLAASIAHATSFARRTPDPAPAASAALAAPRSAPVTRTPSHKPRVTTEKPKRRGTAPDAPLAKSPYD